MGKLRNRIPELLALKEFRNKTRYSQRDMAQGTDLTDVTISRLMRHKTLDNVAYASALAIAKWLEVSMEELTEPMDD